LSEKRNFLSSKLFVSRTAIRFQKVDNTSISERNRHSLDFFVFTLSISSILSVQKIFLDFRNNSISLSAISGNNSISSITQISTKSVLSEHYIASGSEKKRRETSETSTETEERKNILSIRIKISPTVTSIITENNNLVNNSAVQKLINQTIIRTLTSYNIQLNRLFLSVDFSSSADSADQQDSLEQQNFSKSVESADNNISENNVIFRISDLDYFYSDLKKFYNKNNIVTIEKKTIYREIYIFCRRVDDYASIVEKKKIRNYISIYFRDNVLY